MDQTNVVVRMKVGGVGEGRSDRGVCAENVVLHDCVEGVVLRGGGRSGGC